MGAGSGTVAAWLCERVGPTGTVVGLDFSGEMLRVGRERERRSGSRVEFVNADAMRIPAADDRFDVVTIGYGIRNVPDPCDCLREIRRVLKPGGRLVALDFGKPDNPLWRAIYFGYLRLCVPFFGLIFCGKASAYSYILESLKHYPAQRGVEAKMRELGLVNVRVENPLAGAMGINYGEKPVR